MSQLSCDHSYSARADKSQRLFGISLYHQKSVELRPEGRRSFSASSLFTSFGLPPTTPYLSQIPCSWGALYFPEHWREFHAYLPLRLAASSPLAHLVLTENIVPHSRSNRWTHSWKRYFIELVYLRGYVMLYPNYPGELSFSTNHLEPGSHVHDQPLEVYMQKRGLFVVPLMPLPEHEQGEGASTTGLLELPGRSPPGWDDLPTLDLFGMIASSDTLVRRGSTRRMELLDCPSSSPRAFDARSLLCYT